MQKVVALAKQHRGTIVALLAGYFGPKILALVGRSLAATIRTKTEQNHIYVGIELGGTNYKIAFGKPQFDRAGKLIDFHIIKQIDDGRVSDKPGEILAQIAQKIHNALNQNEGIHFVGISCFGPLELNASSPNYGSITSTPKPGWKDTPVLANLKERLRCNNLSIETDVNAAALAQLHLGKHDVKQSLAYITVGTGVGVGLVCHNQAVHGLTHPEGGHIVVKRHPKQYEQFEGVCPFHKCCLEGMVANRSIEKRTNVEYVKLHLIEDTDPIWEIIGYYLAQLCLNITLTASPQRIVIGGGIMNRGILYTYIHQNFLQLLASYVEHPLFTPENVRNYIVEPKLGATVGVKGAMLLNYGNRNNA